MAERDHILANFQACTGKDNFEECIVILEQHDWDLTAALQAALPDDTPAEPIQPLPTRDDPGIIAVDDHFFPPPQPGASIDNPVNIDMPTDFSNIATASSFGAAAVAGSSSSASHSFIDYSKTIRFLRFNVEYRDRNVNLDVQDNDTVETLKILLEEKFGIPRKHMQLTGWKKEHVIDKTILRSLQLPKTTTLILLTPEFTDPIPNADTPPANGQDSGVLERLSQSFTLNIKHTCAEPEKTYKLNFMGSKTIQEVKGDVYDVTSIPVRHQVWSGWPDDCKDESMTLAGSSVSYPCHCLELSRAASISPSPSSSKTNQSDDVMEIDNESDDFEDAHDNFTIDDDELYDMRSRRLNPLIPDDATSHVSALESFSQEFASRYGDVHPVFYIGDLEAAIKEALLTKAKDRKLLAIYLHHDKSILSNVFCSTILCSETIVSYLSTNFITWAWDLTSDINKARLVRMCTQHFGSVAANTVKTFNVDQLPLLLIITRNRSANEVANVIHANLTLDELMTQLMHVVDSHEDQQRKDVIDEEEREQRTNMLQEQDAAYQQSLARDKAKAEQKKKEEEEKKMVEEVEQQKIREEKLQQENEAMEREAIRLSMAEQVPSEPSESCAQPMTRLRIRIPGGDMITRRFLASDSLQTLLNFVASKGFNPNEHKLLTTYPRRDLTNMDLSQTLDELKLCPQETVILEEK